ncbi:MAG: hypothetical protein WCY10_06325, partial [Candidatus Omnitrophota bacterium]
NFLVAGHVAGLASEFKGLGITHYAIEAPPRAAGALDALNKGLTVDLSGARLCPERGFSPGLYEKAARAFARAGITVVPVDIDPARYIGDEDREARIYERVKAIIAKEPRARVAVFIGSFHASKSFLRGNGGSLRTRLTNDGIKASSVVYAGAFDIYPVPFVKAVDSAGVAEQDFMLSEDIQGPDASFTGGEFDHIVYLSGTDGGVKNRVAAGQGDPGGIDLRSLYAGNEPAELYRSAVTAIKKLVIDPPAQAGSLALPGPASMVKPGDTGSIREYIAACLSTGIDIPREKILACLALALKNEEDNALASDPAIKELLVFAESFAGSGV